MFSDVGYTFRDRSAPLFAQNQTLILRNTNDTIYSSVHQCAEREKALMPPDSLSKSDWAKVIKACHEVCLEVAASYAATRMWLSTGQIQTIVFTATKFLIARRGSGRGSGSGSSFPSSYCPGFLLADDMGMGKTRAATALIDVLRLCDEHVTEKEWPGREARPAHNGAVLIVALNSTVPNWEKELRARESTVNRTSYLVNVYSLKRAVSHGAKPFGANARAVLLTSEALKCQTSISWAYGERWLAVVYDEAHILKTDASNTARAASKLRGFANYALSATPVTNTPDDLCNILVWVGHRRQDVATHEQRQRVAANVMLRRTYADVGERLPELVYVPIHVERGPALDRIFAALDRHCPPKKTLAKQSLKRLSLFHEAAIFDPHCQKEWGGFVERHRSELPDPAELPRRSVLVQAMLDDMAAQGFHERDYKVVVMCHWVPQVEHVSKELQVERIRHEVYTGALTREMKNTALHSFVAFDARVMVCNIKCCSHGTDGLQVASTLYILSSDYGAETERQAIGRLHRKGQASDVRVVIISSPSMDTEVRIQELQYKKVMHIEQSLGRSAAHDAHKARLPEGKVAHEARVAQAEEKRLQKELAKQEREEAREQAREEAHVRKDRERVEKLKKRLAENAEKRLAARLMPSAQPTEDGEEVKKGGRQARPRPRPSRSRAAVAAAKADKKTPEDEGADGEGEGGGEGEDGGQQQPRPRRPRPPASRKRSAAAGADRPAATTPASTYGSAARIVLDRENARKRRLAMMAGADADAGITPLAAKRVADAIEAAADAPAPAPADTAASNCSEQEHEHDRSRDPPSVVSRPKRTSHMKEVHEDELDDGLEVERF